MTIQRCRCDSGKPYLACCGRFIEAGASPSAPVELMRSRYTAYCLGNFNYLETTSQDLALALLQSEDLIERTAFNGVRLDVLGEKVIDEHTQTVEFKAYYLKDGRIYEMHEMSTFSKINGTWFYTSGILK